MSSGIGQTHGALKAVHRRAVLVFADSHAFDLARRSLPRAAGQLLNSSALFRGCHVFADVHFFTKAVKARESERIHPQVGRNFRDRFGNAVGALTRLGYDEIVAVGGDCPSLHKNDIVIAFQQLAHNKLVLGPDHRGGCYLIGFHAANREVLHDIRWNRNSDCGQLRARCAASEVFLLPVKQDLDSWADLRLLARTGEAAGKIAAFLVALAGAAIRDFVSFVIPAEQGVRERGQMPPPISAV